MARPMAPAVAEARPRAGARRHVLIAGVVVVVVLAIVMISGFGRAADTSTGQPRQSPAALAAAGGLSAATPSPAGSSSAPGASRPDGSSGPSSTDPESPPPSSLASASPTPAGSPMLGPAPTVAKGFAIRRTVVPMGFPLAANVVYHYRDDFLNPRSGQPETYNHWYRRNADGTIQRAHDGNDVWARRGVHVLAPFSGTVMDPATRWRPWRADRFGRVVAIQSDEPTSVGYVVILAHLDLTKVKVGDHVERGQFVGILGTSGTPRAALRTSIWSFGRRSSSASRSSARPERSTRSTHTRASARPTRR
jgi:murein DD-endopeptidase MepM/ murein hydrolase activator NlpD